MIHSGLADAYLICQFVIYQAHLSIRFSTKRAARMMPCSIMSLRVVLESLGPLKPSPGKLSRLNAPRQRIYGRGILPSGKVPLVGAVQLLIYGPPMLILKTLGKPKYIHYHAKTAQALGKMFWWSGFKQKLYGVNATTEQPAV